MSEKYNTYSVLMSVYSKEKPEYLRESIDSMLRQTLLTDDFVLIEDGKLTDELETVVKYYENTYPEIIHVFRRDNNLGLGLSLQEGVLKCKNEIIARMDSDDYSVPSRCKTELNLINDGSDLVGSGIKEFEGNIDNVKNEKNMPISLEDIKQYSRYRNPFNHSTVMFRKNAILKAGNYRNLTKLEDYDLWMRVLYQNGRVCNYPDPLVYMRVNDDFYRRRGGKENLRSHINLRKELYMRKQICLKECFFGCFLILVRSICPRKLKLFIYRKVLRKGN